MSWVNRVLGDNVDDALSMSKEAKIQRAKEMGFNTDTTFYHGSPYAGNINEFKNEFTGKGNDQWGSGFYFSDVPNMASGYASDLPTPSDISKYGDPKAGVIPVYLNLKNPIKLDNQEHFGLRDLPEQYRPNKSQIKEIINKSPYIDDPDNSPLGDWFPEYWEEGKQDWMIDELASKYEGVPLDNIEYDLFGTGNDSGAFRKAYSDATGYDGLIVESKFGNKPIAVAFQPNQIRSVNAAFDPKKADSSDLMALNGKNKISTNPLDYINPQAVLQPEMRAIPEDQITWSDKVNNAIYLGLEESGVSDKWARKLSEDAGTALSVTGIDSAMTLADAAQGRASGVDAALSLLDFIPGIGKGANMAAKQIFAGAKAAARLGKLDDMRKAEKLLDTGASNERVYRETGFFKGKDGQMRFEIDDSKADYIPDAVTEDLKNEVMAATNWDSDKAQRYMDRNGADTTASKVLLHPELYKAYPEIQSNPVKIQDLSKTPYDGYFTPDVSLIGVNSKSSEGRNTILHELQHLVQKTEGFDRGTNSVKAAAQREDLEYALKQQNDSLYDFRNALTNDFEAMDQTRKQWVDASKYKDYQKLVDYANSDNPTAIKRHIMGMDYYLHADGIRDMPEAKELARRRYDMPKSSRPKQERAAWLRDYAFDMSQLVKKTIDDDSFKALKGDKRKIDSIIKKNERDLDRKRKELDPYYKQKSYVDQLEEVNDNLRGKTDQKVYEYKFGEAEARNTENRSSMSKEDRMKSYPDSTLTVDKPFGGKERVDPKYLWTEDMLKY